MQTQIKYTLKNVFWVTRQSVCHHLRTRLTVERQICEKRGGKACFWRPCHYLNLPCLRAEWACSCVYAVLCPSQTTHHIASDSSQVSHSKKSMWKQALHYSMILIPISHGGQCQYPHINFTWFTLTIPPHRGSTFINLMNLFPHDELSCHLEKTVVIL